MTARTATMLRVGLSGALATAVDLLVLVLGVELLGLPVGAAAFVGVAAGGIANFTVNKHWALSGRASLGAWQVVRFAGVAVVTASFMALAVHALAVVVGLPYLVAKALGSILVFFAWSYPAQSRLVFPRVRASECADVCPSSSLC